jgi:hypothetical protein
MGLEMAFIKVYGKIGDWVGTGELPLELGAASWGIGVERSEGEMLVWR